MPFIEAPTTFYLGRQYDPHTRQLIDDVVYYDSRDLTTHAVVVGMTGSGKTGLCMTLLEEAALDNIPAIIIDPKGDITNLLLMFDHLSPEEFRPWINVDDARRAGMTVDEYAQDVAQRWQDGLASWGIGPHRIQALKSQVELNIYTPGSDAGLPISILEAMQAPRTGWQGQEEYHREQIRGITTAMLALIGLSANPVKDREHVLIANIFEHAWKQGLDLTMEDIIVQVQQPPFSKLGVLDIDSFFPEKSRFKLAMELNNIIAAPSFQSWMRGDPLDMQHLMYNAQGKPRINVFYIAHLDESQRSFFITLLLENVLSSMRTMSGTTSLRAILYFDEVFGHFPPYPKNPPTKQPLLRLLKQARAFGIGLILATQNPGDLDYKGLSNAGTWFIGRLQTENDKKKVLDGLAVAASAEQNVDLGDLDTLISSVDPRVFVMNNIHNSGGPILMHTRWAMSYLRGPLTRDQIFQLMKQRRAEMQQQSYGAQYGAYGQQPYAPQYQQQVQQHFQAQPAQNYGQPAMGTQNPYQPGTGGNQAYTPPSPPPPPPPIQNSQFYAPPQAPYAQQQPPPPVMGAPAPPPNLPEQFSNPAVPPPGLPESYAQQHAPQTYQAPNAPYTQEQPYSPQTYTPPAPPYQQQQQQGYNTGNDPFGGTGQYTPPPQYTPTPPSQTGQYTPGGGYINEPPPPQSSTSVVSTRDANLPAGFSYTRVSLGSDVEQYFFPVTVSLQQAIARWERQSSMRAQGFGGHEIVYVPMLLAQVQARYLDRKTNVNMVEAYAYHIPNIQKSGLIHWNEYRAPAVDTRHLASEPFDNKSIYGDVTLGLTDKSRMTALKKEVVDYIYKTAGLVIPFNPTLKIYGTPGAGYNDFRTQVSGAAREGRDAEVDKLTEQFEGRFDKLEEKYRREMRELDADRDQLKELGREELFTMGEAFMSLLKGRTAYTLSRVSRARRYKGSAQEDLSESEAVLIEIERNMDELQDKFEYELDKIQKEWVDIANQAEEVRVTPYKKDIHVEVFGVGWIPQYMLSLNNQPIMIEAWEFRSTAPPREQSNNQGFSGGGGGQPQDGYDDEFGGQTYRQDDYR